MKRRHFLHHLPMLSAIPVLGQLPLGREMSIAFESLSDFAKKRIYDETDWAKVKAAFNLSNTHLDFNSAGLSAMTKNVLKGYETEIHKLYELPSRRINDLRVQKKLVVSELANMVKCEVAEIVLQRNATEALSAAIFGIPLQRGDEVIVGQYDYPHMYFAWKQRADRDGIILKYADFGPSPKSPKEIIKTYLKQVTAKTKAIFLTDLINYSGCQIPTKKILASLPDHVRYRIVDAAQSFANSRNDFPAFGATHVGTSLHKWLGAPAASGMLYVKKEFIQETWPLFASRNGHESKIQKFSHLGTLNAAMYPAVLLAIQFHQHLGAQNKYDRLIELSDYFVKQISKIDKVEIVSPRHKKLKSNLVVFNINGVAIKNITHQLLTNYNIHTTQSNWESIHGVRVSLNVFTSKKDIDQLVEAVKEISI